VVRETTACSGAALVVGSRVFTPKGAGSIPVRSTLPLWSCGKARLPLKEKIVGSSPIRGAQRKETNA
jgi:hypothetical protein